jgi:hypothetical protein
MLVDKGEVWSRYKMEVFIRKGGTCLLRKLMENEAIIIF